MQIVKLFFFLIWTLQKNLPHKKYVSVVPFLIESLEFFVKSLPMSVGCSLPVKPEAAPRKPWMSISLCLAAPINPLVWSFFKSSMFDLTSSILKKEINNYLQKNSWKQNLSEFFKFFREIKVYYLHYYTYRRTLHNHLHYYKNFVGQIVYSFLSVSLLLKKKSTVFSQFYG